MKHQLNIDNEKIEYTIRRSNRSKRIALRILEEKGLELVLPNRVSISKGEEFLYRNVNWVKKNFKKIRTCKEKKFYYFGIELQLEIIRRKDIKNEKVEIFKDRLSILAQEGAKVDPHSVYLKWLRKEAKKYLIERTKLLADRYDFNNYNQIYIRSQKSKWGSCSSKKNLSFNYKLLYFNREVIDYVIIHELCHLKELNHSKKFWKLVEGIMPDYKYKQRELINYFSTKG